MTENNTEIDAKQRFVLPIVIITVGIGWLLSARHIGPGINWIWVLGLGVAGILTFVMSGGIDKFSIIFGPFFLACSVLAIMRQTGKLELDTEVPVLVILIGVLLMAAQFQAVPPPKWFVPLTKSPK